MNVSVHEDQIKSRVLGLHGYSRDQKNPADFHSKLRNLRNLLLTKVKILKKKKIIGLMNLDFSSGFLFLTHSGRAVSALVAARSKLGQCREEVWQEGWPWSALCIGNSAKTSCAHVDRVGLFLLFHPLKRSSTNMQLFLKITCGYWYTRHCATRLQKKVAALSS